MLSSEANESVTPNGESQAAAPPQRRRRAASRPAGAPKTAPAPAETSSPQGNAPEAPATADAPATQPPAPEAAAPAASRARTRAPRASAPTSASEDTSTSETPGAEPVDTSATTPAEDLAPKRRRAATKPAGRATTTRRRKVEVDSDAEQAPEPAKPASERVEAQPPAAEPQEEAAEKAPTRRRASRRAAAPAQPAPTTEATPEPDEAVPAQQSETPAEPVSPQQAETPAEPVSPQQEESPAQEPTREPAALGRGRQSRALGKGAQARAIEAGKAEQAETQDAPADDSHTSSEAQQTPQRSRRRRATRATSAPEEQKSSSAADPDEDPIAAALRAAEEIAEARRAVLSDPFITAQARDAQLAALARSIAAGVSGEQPEPAEAASDEDAADEEPEDDLDPAEGISDDDDAASDDDGQESEDALDAEDDSDDSDDDDDSPEGERPTRRRRRRGGRRRRRGGPGSDADADDADDSSDDSDDDESEATEDAGVEDETTDDADGDSGTVRRRRRRRRRSGDTASDSSHDDEVTGIEGSTRMEAKRQRRKESRAAGRRRAPILSEAEFLARRESVDRKLVIRQSEDYTQLAVIEDDILVEHYVDKASATSLIGNVYVGKVQNVLPSMEAAFIDIGRGRNAVLYAGEVDWDSFEVSGENRKVENVLKSGQSVLVQVTKDPVGAKGARLTGHISLPGRYIVYSPGGHLSGISRKLPDVERNRLRTILAGLISDQESVIVRTAAEGVNEEELIRDVNRLKAQWEVIEQKSKKGAAPQALYAEPDLTLRIVRDLFTEDFGKLIVQGDGGPEDTYDAISAYVSHVAPHLQERLERFDVGENGQDVFAKFKVDEQIAKALDRKVFLPSGGSLVIDRTEAMTVVDVNTGRFTGAGGNLEATVTSNNLEAAEEVVRQLRLRDIGGIIVIDFIDMVLPSNRDLLLRRLVECLSRDRTRHQVSEVTSLGLVQLTRKKIGTGLQEAFTEPCEHCNGQGYQRFEDPVDSQAPSDGGDRKGGNARRRGGRGR